MVTPRDRWRASDHDRERVADALGDRYALGQLTWEEYSERLDACWSARTWADLDQLFHDLPLAARPSSQGTATTGRPGPERRRHRPPVLLLVLAAIVTIALLDELVWVLVPLLVLFVVLRRRRRRAHLCAQHRETRAALQQPRWMRG